VPHLVYPPNLFIASSSPKSKSPFSTTFHLSNLHCNFFLKQINISKIFIFSKIQISIETSFSSTQTQKLLWFILTVFQSLNVFWIHSRFIKYTTIQFTNPINCNSMTNSFSGYDVFPFERRRGFKLIDEEILDFVCY